MTNAFQENPHSGTIVREHKAAATTAGILFLIGTVAASSVR